MSDPEAQGNTSKQSVAWSLQIASAAYVVLHLTMDVAQP